MSQNFAATAKALEDDPALKARVLSAESAEERAEHLRAAGVYVPTHDDVNQALAGVAGGVGTFTTTGGQQVMAECAAQSAAG